LFAQMFPKMVVFARIMISVCAYPYFTYYTLWVPQNTSGFFKTWDVADITVGARSRKTSKKLLRDSVTSSSPKPLNITLGSLRIFFEVAPLSTTPVANNGNKIRLLTP